MGAVQETGVDTILYPSGSGWCGVAIGAFRGCASYLNDVAFDFLHSFKQWIDNKCIPVVFCDEEGSEFRIVIEEYNAYIIQEKDEAKLYSENIIRKDFVKTILMNIEENLNWFALDFADNPDDENEILQRKIDILSNIKYIKEHIEEF